MWRWDSIEDLERWWKLKIIIGVDSSEESQNAVRLIGRLAFAGAQVQLVHVIERLWPEEWKNKPQSANDLLTNFMKMAEREGEQILRKSEQLAQGFDIKVEKSLKFSSTIANQVLESAKDQNASLIAVGSRDESIIGKILIGSVGRKLIVSSPQSVCICRTDFTESSGSIDAVFATDHSEYANQCADILLALAPKGLRKLTVMTAYPKHLVKVMKDISPQVPANISKWLEDHMELQNQILKERLSKLGIEIQSRVIEGEPEAAIETTMQDTQSKLLIMGAQGHGFIERLVTGSLTFRQAASGKHSVLILRA